MGFFAEFNAWLNALLLDYISLNAARVAHAIEPLAVTLGILYVMVWGYMHLTGQIEEPFTAGLKRIVALAVIFGVAIHLWLYNDLIVNTFFGVPAALATLFVGAFDTVQSVDSAIGAGGGAGEALLRKGGLFGGNIAYYLAGIFVYATVGLTAVYTIFLLALSRVALSVLLALGPLFILLSLFDTTRRFCEAWLAQLANYGFIAVLAVLCAALMLHVLTTAAQQAAAQGGEITIALAVRVCMAAGLTFLVMRQVMPMAAGLASGLALSTFGVTSAAVGWALGSSYRKGTRSLGEFGRGLTDTTTSRWDSWSRKAGYYARRGVGRLVARPNQIRARS